MKIDQKADKLSKTKTAGKAEKVEQSTKAGKELAEKVVMKSLVSTLLSKTEVALPATETGPRLSRSQSKVKAPAP